MSCPICAEEGHDGCVLKATREELRGLLSSRAFSNERIEEEAEENGYSSALREITTLIQDRLTSLEGRDD